MRDPRGSHIGFAKVTRDMTQAVEAQERLKASNRALEHLTMRLKEQAALLQLAHDAIIVRGEDSVIRSWNMGAETTYGWHSEDAIGQVSHDLLKTVWPVPKDEVDRQLAEHGFWEGELLHRTRDGRTLTIASRQASRRSEMTGELQTLEINRDVTEKRRAEDSVRQLSGYVLRAQDEERRRIG